jgi:hypothetical protein
MNIARGAELRYSGAKKAPGLATRDEVWIAAKFQVSQEY